MISGANTKQTYHKLVQLDMDWSIRYEAARIWKTLPNNIPLRKHAYIILTPLNPTFI